MVAINDQVKGCMKYNISVLYERMLCLLHFEMSHDECIELVAPSEHLNILRTASEYAVVGASESWMYIPVPGVVDASATPTICLMMRTHKNKVPPLMPRHPTWQEGHPEATTKVLNWVQKRMEYGRAAALADYALDRLAELCDNGQQVRFLWPAIMHLTKRGPNWDDGLISKMNKWVERNGLFKACKNVPAIDKPLRQAIIESSGWITAASLLGEDIAEQPAGQVAINLGGRVPFDHYGVQLVRR